MSPDRLCAGSLPETSRRERPGARDRDGRRAAGRSSGYHPFLLPAGAPDGQTDRQPSMSVIVAESCAPAQKSRLYRLRWIVPAAAVLAIIVAVAVRGRTSGAAAALDKALVATARRADLDVTVLETGRIEPRAQAQVKSRVGGQVTDVTVQEGEKVKVGQILVRLEPTDYQRDVARQEAEIQQQRLALEYASLQLGRAERSRAVAIAPQMELDQARHEAATARARLTMSRVALATARDRLRYTAIEAPIAGTVTQRGINPGEVVVPGVTATVEGKPLLVIADLSTLLVKIDLNQIDVARVRKGQAAEITVDALPGKKYTAHITKVAPAAVAAARGQGADVFPVEAELDPAQDLAEIKPGMTADVRIVVATEKGVLLLPIEAVVTSKEQNRVTVIDDGGRQPRTTTRDVTVGARNDRDVQIKSGLRQGDRVLINPPAPSEVKL
jgi:macrolide-specific efflux system membrane fusion protein